MKKKQKKNESIDSKKMSPTELNLKSIIECKKGLIPVNLQI